ncbi:hypothetical protein [Pseudactinotalea suaedae]|uniref:hypothetical protein n=1 Tax=Pseudactinotalea suaedae TaxID=1524924 RepID=UPI0012E2F722|nr:hypothetical protein [Pseudactinotalea suaedae]
MNLVLASTQPVVVPENPWPGIELTWTSPDGSRTWSLTNELSPVRLAGTRGLGKPPSTRYADEAPGLPGSRYRGHRVNEREVFWPFLVLAGADTQEHLDVEAEFWQSLSYEEQGTWRAITPDRGARSLRCRLERDDTVWDLAPGLMEWTQQAAYLVADQPFWTSDPIVRVFGAADGARFADPATPELWRISSASTLSTATIPNPGDVAGAPVWAYDGPFDSAYGGFEGKHIVIPFAVAEGKSLVVDSSREDRRALLVDTPDLTGLDAVQQVQAIHAAALAGGVDRTKDLGGETAFAEIPKGANVTLDVGMVGTGTVRVLLTPRHERAWG